jgi:hypothetical protein
MRPYEEKRNFASLHGLETPGHPILFFTLLSMLYPLAHQDFEHLEKFGVGLESP